MSIKPVSIPTKTLGSSINSSATSFTLSDITGWDGNDLTASDFGTQAYGIFRNAARTQIELFEFDPSTIASASITITRRGLKFTGDLTTEVAGNKLTWTKGDTFVDIGSDVPQLFQWLQENAFSFIRYMVFNLCAAGTLTIADRIYQRVPAALNGMRLISVKASVGTGASGSSSSGLPTFTVKNVTDNQQMLSTSLTVDVGEYTSATATTPAVIDTSYDDVATDDLIEVAATSAGTGVTYATVTLEFTA